MHHIPRGVGKRLTQDAETAEAMDGGGCFLEGRTMKLKGGIWEHEFPDGTVIRCKSKTVMEKLLEYVELRNGLGFGDRWVGLGCGAVHRVGGGTTDARCEDD